MYSDLDEDNQISERDITEIIDRITCDPNCYNRYLDNGSKKKIANIVRTTQNSHIKLHIKVTVPLTLQSYCNY